MIRLKYFICHNNIVVLSDFKIKFEPEPGFEPRTFGSGSFFSPLESDNVHFPTHKLKVCSIKQCSLSVKNCRYNLHFTLHFHYHFTLSKILSSYIDRFQAFLSVHFFFQSSNLHLFKSAYTKFHQGFMGLPLSLFPFS